MTTANTSSGHDSAAGPSLTAAERARLAALLGMCGSPHDGERAAAALLASRWMRERGLAWIDVLVPAAVDAPHVDDWRRQAAEAAQYPGLLSAWERDFLGKLRAFPQISDKQRSVLERIVSKVRA